MGTAVKPVTQWKRGRRQQRLPALFGGYGRTELLVTLAKAGRIRRGQLLKHFSDGITKSRTRVHPALLTVRWQLNGKDVALALNPWIPLAAELRQLLLAMGSDYAVLPTCDVPKSKWTIPASAMHALPHLPQMEYLFITPTRTLTLLTLEVLGGRCPEHFLVRCVPGGYQTSLRRVVSHFVDEGILMRDGGNVAFSDLAWIPKLRKLLRAYRRHDPHNVAEIKSLSREGAGKRISAAPFALMGTELTQRILIHLAASGPVRFARLWAAMKSKSELSIAVLESMGIVATLRDGAARSYCLNAGHPVYRELRSFLQALGAAPRRAKSDDRAVSKPNPTADRLFGTEMRTTILLAIAASGKSGLDGSSLERLFPEYSRQKMQWCLHRFEGLGIVEQRPWKTIIYFRLFRGYAHYTSLLRLLNAMNRAWPQYAVWSVGVLKALQPPNRRTMEKAR